MPQQNPLQELHGRAGATMAEWFGCVLPDSFTDFDTEYRRARESVALIDKTHRAWFSFDGADRVRYLNAILTNNIRDLAPGGASLSLLLNPQGHILAELEIQCLPDRLVGVSYAMIRESLTAELDRYIIMDDVTLEDQTDQLGALALEGPRAPEILRALTAIEFDSLAELGHQEADVAGMSCRIERRSPSAAMPGVEFTAARAQLPELWEELARQAEAHGGGPIGYAVLSAVRLEDGIPWFGYDFDSSVIPHEAGLENSHINYTKGCYVGQEIVERVRSRGHVNRKRVGLAVSGDGLPAPGAKLFVVGKEAGHFTRSAHSPAIGRGIAMGYLRREHTAPGSEVTWEGGTARVVELPLRKAGA